MEHAANAGRRRERVRTLRTPRRNPPDAASNRRRLRSSTRPGWSKRCSASRVGGREPHPAVAARGRAALRAVRRRDASDANDRAISETTSTPQRRRARMTARLSRIGVLAQPRRRHPLEGRKSSTGIRVRRRQPSRPTGGSSLSSRTAAYPDDDELSFPPGGDFHQRRAEGRSEQKLFEQLVGSEQRGPWTSEPSSDDDETSAGTAKRARPSAPVTFLGHSRAHSCPMADWWLCRRISGAHRLFRLDLVSTEPRATDDLPKARSPMSRRWRGGSGNRNPSPRSRGRRGRARARVRVRPRLPPRRGTRV